MSLLEWRLLSTHPLRWGRHYWPHLTLALLLWTIAAQIAMPTFEGTFASRLWPIYLGIVGALVLVSALYPFDRVMQALTGSALVGAGALRSLTWAEVVLFDPPLLGVDETASSVFALLWLVVALLGGIWPKVSEIAGTNASVEAGNEARADAP